MKKILASSFVLFLLVQSTSAQDPVRPRALGVSFVLNDFVTAQRIRSSSIEQVLHDDKWAQLSEMSAGIGLTYFKGLQKHLDFAGTITASFVNYPFPNKSAFSSDAVLLEADASVHLKLFDESYWFTPYISAGVGASKYKQYYGAIMPLGIGVKLNVFDEVSIFANSQYRIPVTAETANYHLMYSIGVAGLIGKGKR